jgi:transcriptional regulator NrdR family protein
VFTTEESVRLPLSWRVKTAGGGLEPFSRDKLFVSLHKSLQHRKTALEDADALSDTVIRRLTDRKQSRAIDKAQIIKIVQVTLTRFDRAAAVHYEVHHQ